MTTKKKTPTRAVKPKTGVAPSGPTAAQRELMMLYILMGKDPITYSPTKFNSGDELVTKIATDYQSQTGSTWNWNALTPEKAGEFAQGAIDNPDKDAFDAVGAQFQIAANAPMAWPGGGGTHPDAHEVGTALSVG